MINQQLTEEATHVRETLEYVARFKNEVFTIAIDIDCLQDCDQATLVRDLMLLRACNIRICVILGSLKSPKPDKENDIIAQIDESMRQIVSLADGMCNETIASASAKHQFRDHAFSISEMADGEMALVLTSRLPDESIPLISCADKEKCFIMPLPRAAEVVAKSVGARKLIFLTDYDGIYVQSKKLLRHVHPNQVSDLIKAEEITGALADISEGAIASVQGGVRRAHIINGRKPYSLLLEICSKDGVGTMIYRGPYREIRMANESDIVGIIDLLNRYGQTGIIRQLSHSDLKKKLKGIFVATVDDKIIGCGCIQKFPEEQKGFVSSVAVDPSYISEGVGSQLFGVIEQHAKESGIKLLTLVSPKSRGWWLHQEFKQSNLEKLPKAIQAMYGKDGGHSFLEKQL